MNVQLQTLGCNDYSTLEEIKKAYRALSLKCHPDLNKNIDPQKFIDLTKAYDWLMSNHKPKKRPIKDHSEKFYKQWSTLTSDMYVHLPIDFVHKDTSIYCMVRYTEFRVKLEAGTQLPVSLLIKNVFDRPFTLHVIGSPVTEDYMNDDL